MSAARVGSAASERGGGSSRRALAGQPPPIEVLIDPARLCWQYYARQPDAADPAQRVSFGTSGHRGSALRGSFNEAHVLAITQAICEFRSSYAVDGPLYIGKDTHALSEPALHSALEVLAANAVETMIDRDDGYTPTPAVSHAILTYNRRRSAHLADGIVITPSHNPPEDGGFKYNPTHGGPADAHVTQWIEARANALLPGALRGIKRIPYETARGASTTHRHDYITAYVDDLDSVVDLACVRAAGLKLGVDPLGGASVGYWGPIAELCRGHLLADPAVHRFSRVIDGTLEDSVHAARRRGRERYACLTSLHWSLQRLRRLHYWLWLASASSSRARVQDE